MHLCKSALIFAALILPAFADQAWLQLESHFRTLPMEARRMTGPLFWLHGDENENKERLQSYVDKVTDQHQVRGINFMIPHSFNPKAPNDTDYPPYFYNDGKEARWPLYKIWTDYSNRLSLMLTGGHHVCPVAILFSGNARRVGDYITPEQLTTALQDAQYDADWLPFEAFEAESAKIEPRGGGRIALHGESYEVLVVPPTEVMPAPVLAKVKAFMDTGGVVIGYGRLPSVSGTIGQPSSMIAHWRELIWGEITISLEPMESVLVVFNRQLRELPMRITSSMLESAPTLDLQKTEGRNDGYAGKLMLDPKYKGKRFVLTMEGLGAEEAARVRINGVEAGGFIGKPYQLDISSYLKSGEDQIDILPFAPESVALKVLD